MTIRVLIVGTNKSYCDQIKEFFELRGHITTTVQNYSEGFEKLFFEKPHITVFEFTSEAISASFLSRIKKSDRLQLVDQKEYTIESGYYPVFLLQDYDKVKSLYDNIEKALKNIDFKKQDAQPDETGDLENVFLPRLLKEIESEKRSGLLVLNSNFETKIYFQEGIPIYSEGSNLETGLGRMLLSDNKINSEQYNEVISELDGNRKGQKIGEILISKGYISPHDLNKCLELQIREKIISGFLLTKGKFSFKYNVEIPEDIYPFKFDVDEIIYEGMMRFIDVSGLDSSNLEISASTNLFKKTKNMHLGPKELRVTQMLSKQNSLIEILANVNIDKERVLKLLYFLAFNKLITLEGLSIDNIGKASFSKMNSELYSDKEGAKESQPEKTDSEEDILVLDEDSIMQEELTLEASSDVESREAEKQSEREETIALEQEINPEQEEATALNLEDLENEKLQLGPKEGLEIEEPSSENQEDKITLEVKETSSESVPTTKEIEPEKVNAPTNETVETKGPEIKTEEISEEKLKEEKERVHKEVMARIDEFYNKLEDDFYSLLNVGENAEANEIKNSYLNLVKQFHPDKIFDYPDQVRDKAEEIFSKLTFAYETLIDDNSRDNYDSRTELDDLKGKAGDIYEAEVNFNEGEALLRRRNYAEAVTKFKNAVDLNPEESAYMGAYGSAKFYAADNKESAAKEVIGIIEKAISLDKGYAMNYYYLGSVYKINNNLHKAEKNFEKALEIDKTLIEAKRELRLIVNRRVERKSQKASSLKGKGIEKRFWSGLFKK